MLRAHKSHQQRRANDRHRPVPRGSWIGESSRLRSMPGQVNEMVINSADWWYFRTYNDQAIRMIDLHAALAAAGNKVGSISMNSQQSIIDASTALRAAND
jgi:hypothetical protein